MVIVDTLARSLTQNKNRDKCALNSRRNNKKVGDTDSISRYHLSTEHANTLRCVYTLCGVTSGTNANEL